MSEPSVDSHHLLDLFASLRGHLDRLPLRPLGPGEHTRLICHLFPRDLELVQEVAFALSLRPELFTDLDVTGAEIGEDERRAAAWLGIARLLQVAGALCMQQHVRALAGAVLKSKRAVRTIAERYNHRALLPGLDHQRRLDLISPALLCLQGDREARRRKAKVRSSPAALAEAPAPRAAPTKRARRGAALMGRLGELLGGLSGGE